MTFGPKELQADVQQKKICIGCGACVSICPYFRTYKGQTTAIFQCSRTTGRCYAFCPKTGVDLDKLSKNLFKKEYGSDPLGNYKAIYVSEKGDKASKGNGSTVSALIEFALKNKVIDSAILNKLNGAAAAPEIVTDPEKVKDYSSSKSGLSPVVSIFNQGSESGYKKIGLVGTPCTIIALSNIKSNPTDLANFTDKSGIAIGLFCSWAHGASKFEDAVASEERKTMPLGCSYCHDMTGEFADISVGALDSKGDKNKNILIVRTEAGEKLVNDAIKSGYIKTSPLPADALDALSKASMSKKKRTLARLVEEKKINALAERPTIVINDQSLKNITNDKGGM